jgi:hypothetical protein
MHSQSEDSPEKGVYLLPVTVRAGSELLGEDHKTGPHLNGYRALKLTEVTLQEREDVSVRAKGMGSEGVLTSGSSYVQIWVQSCLFASVQRRHYTCSNRFAEDLYNSLSIGSQCVDDINCAGSRCH